MFSQQFVSVCPLVNTLPLSTSRCPPPPLLDSSVTLQLTAAPGGYTYFHSTGCTSGNIASGCVKSAASGTVNYGSIQFSATGNYNLQFSAPGYTTLDVSITVAGGNVITEVASIAGTLTGNTLSSVSVVAAARAADNS